MTRDVIWNKNIIVNAINPHKVRGDPLQRDVARSAAEDV